MKTNKMKIRTFVTNCVRYGIEFDTAYCDYNGYDEYCVRIILSNHEYIVPTWDEHKLAEIWNEILEYYIY